MSESTNKRSRADFGEEAKKVDGHVDAAVGQDGAADLITPSKKTKTDVDEKFTEKKGRLIPNTFTIKHWRDADFMSENIIKEQTFYKNGGHFKTILNLVVSGTTLHIYVQVRGGPVKTKPWLIYVTHTIEIILPTPPHLTNYKAYALRFLANASLWYYGDQRIIPKFYKILFDHENSRQDLYLATQTEWCFNETEEASAGEVIYYNLSNITYE